MEIKDKTIVALSANENQVTLYCDDGEVISLQSDMVFTKKVLDKVNPALNAGETVKLNMRDETLDIFHKLQEKTNGFIKFFRVLKSALIGGEEPTKESIESIALPIQDYSINSPNETIVAIIEPEHEDHSLAVDVVVDEVTEPQSTIITGAEKLASQIKHFSEEGNPQGFKNFMKRMGKLKSKRSHSAEELLNFLQKNDLPIADDGSIVAYKAVNKVSRPDHKGDWFVDCHTSKVWQTKGSHVFMAEALVNPDRNQTCSHGLHIGRRDYMGSFSGNAILVLKIAPEDVITVPTDYNGAKMRACGYYIAGSFNDEAFKLLKKNQAATTNEETALMLAEVISNMDNKITHTIEITGNRGTGLKETFTEETETPSVESEKKELKPVQALEEVKETKPKIDKKINSPKKIKQATKKATPKVEMTEHQKTAKKLWKKIQSGEMTKVALAKQCKTSSRTLDRWAEKFKF